MYSMTYININSREKRVATVNLCLTLFCLDIVEHEWYSMMMSMFVTARKRPVPHK